jgi:uncharacterized protein YggU (UPF0235/DUF167 family)
MSGIAGDLFTVIAADSTEELQSIDVTFTLRTEAGTTKVSGRAGSRLQVQCAAPPGSPRANASCVALLATTLGIEPGAVVLIAGEKGREKHLRAKVTDLDDVRRKIDVAIEEAAMANVAKGRRSR